jgi:prepilin-type N-terminal cleavage/methylation domain-containing protein
MSYHVCMIHSRRGFTLIEVLVVVTIISLLIGVTTVSVQTSRARSRDNQVKAEKQTLILALVKAKDVDASGEYPVALGAGVCLKGSGTCWRGNYSGNSTVSAALTPQVPGGVIPKPPGAVSGEYRFDSYLLYRPNFSVAGFPPGTSFLIWPQEKSIPTSECNGQIQQLDVGLWYCYEKLP